MTKVDLVEVGGRGGVYQHTVEVARLLANRAAVTLHTAKDAEILQSDLVVCPCFDWHRGARRLRAVRIVLSFVFRTIPHLAAHRADTTWVQGGFKPSLTALLILVLRLSGRRTLFSPHNLFSRSGSRLDEMLLRLAARWATRPVVYNAVDKETLLSRSRGAVVQLPLVLWAPSVSEDMLKGWYERLPSHGPTVAFVGQIRSDKRLSILIEAAAMAGVQVAVVGPDAGDALKARKVAEDREASVAWFVDYHELQDLAALLVLVDLVACPYDRVSQSGVEALADRFGVSVLGPRLDWLNLSHAEETDRWAELLTEHVKYPTFQDRQLRPKDHDPDVLGMYFAVVDS